MQEDGLALDYPDKEPAKLTGPDERGRWSDEINGNEVSFAMDDAGQVTALVLHQIMPLTRITATDEN